MEERDQPRERDEQQRGRDQIGEEDPHPHAFPPATGEAGQAVAGRNGHHDGDQNDPGHHHQGVKNPAWEVRLGEEQPHVVDRRRIVEDPGHVPQVGGADVEVPVLLQGGDHHPVEREAGEDRKAQGGRIEGCPLEGPPEADRLHWAPTSARRATRNIPTATTIRKGSKKTPIAAPCPRSAPRIPRWKASVGSTWVALAGPPPVRM